MIDFNEIPEVKTWVEHQGERDNDWMLPDVGRRITLDIEVTDPRLMQSVLASITTNKVPLGIPGAKILVAHFDDKKSMIANWLRQQLAELER